eukprot:gnl/Chilomastix_cuspidata/2186.p1 GENE.gnl/Chilomastix_cuspidata/2186~~gnl/Chilomastix_cuspidata/2186.p1  ORF type:complete len:310 (+),score=102.85 gnl/Chilomastix_cuspidata/2186:135-1064(+)
MNALLGSETDQEGFVSSRTVIDCLRDESDSNCFHASVLFAFSFITFLFGAVFLAISVKHGSVWLSSKNSLLFLGSLNCVLVFVNYGVVYSSYFAIFNTFLTILQTLLLAYHFLDFFLTKMRSARPRSRRTLIVLFVAVAAVLLAMTVAYCFKANDARTCTDAYWFVAALIGVVLAVLFVVAVWRILHVASAARGLIFTESSRRKEVLVPTVFNLIGFLDLLAYNLCELVTVTCNGGSCDVFVDGLWANELLYTVLKALYMFVPMWGLLIIFRPHRSRKETPLLGHEHNASYDFSDLSSISSSGFHLARR